MGMLGLGGNVEVHVVVGCSSVVPSVLRMVGRSTRRCMDVGKHRLYLLENREVVKLAQRQLQNRCCVQKRRDEFLAARSSLRSMFCATARGICGINLGV